MSEALLLRLSLSSSSRWAAEFMVSRPMVIAAPCTSYQLYIAKLLAESTDLAVGIDDTKLDAARSEAGRTAVAGRALLALEVALVETLLFVDAAAVVHVTEVEHQEQAVDVG